MVECGGLENRFTCNPGNEGSNPSSSARDAAAPRQGRFFAPWGRGFEPMRWNSVKKTCRWHVFRNSPDRACEGGVGLRRRRSRNPSSSARDAAAPRQGRFFAPWGRGFEPMRWNSVKKTCRWHVFRNSPDRACEGGVGLRRRRSRNPSSSARDAAAPRQGRFFAPWGRGFEPMRWNSVKKTCRYPRSILITQEYCGNFCET